jgi:hypothetical protein
MNGLSTLGWELTVQNSLEDPASPCRSVLKKNCSYGNLLFDLLSSKIDFSNINSVIEVGGGYGFLMKDFLSRHADIRAYMIDISPELSARQAETLYGLNAVIINDSFFNLDNDFLGEFELLIMNEVAGDLQAIINIDPDDLGSPDIALDPVLLSAKNAIDEFDLSPPDYPFEVNIGAIEAINKIASAKIPYVFISEHSSELSGYDFYNGGPFPNHDGYPKRIILHGHDEYTVKFSWMEKAFAALGYDTTRGGYSDFIELNMDERLNFILRSNSSNDEHEAIRQFVDDINKYEYLIASKSIS